MSPVKDQGNVGCWVPTRDGMKSEECVWGFRMARAHTGPPPRLTRAVWSTSTCIARPMCPGSNRTYFARDAPHAHGFTRLLGRQHLQEILVSDQGGRACVPGIHNPLQCPLQWSRAATKK